MFSCSLKNPFLYTIKEILNDKTQFSECISKVRLLFSLTFYGCQEKSLERISPLQALYYSTRSVFNVFFFNVFYKHALNFFFFFVLLKLNSRILNCSFSRRIPVSTINMLSRLKYLQNCYQITVKNVSNTLSIDPISSNNCHETSASFR